MTHIRKRSVFCRIERSLYRAERKKRRVSEREMEWLFGELVPYRKGSSCRTAVHAQLVEDMHQVAIDGAFANHQRVSDFLITCAGRDQSQYLHFTGGQVMRMGWSCLRWSGQWLFYG